MTTCHHCGQDIIKDVSWGGLRITFMDEVYWRGEKVHMTLAWALILKALARNGEATHRTLELQSATVTGACLNTQIFYLRRRLAEAGIPLRILSVPYRGYRLEQVQ